MVLVTVKRVLPLVLAWVAVVSPLRAGTTSQVPAQVSAQVLPAGLENAMKQSLPSPADLPKGIEWKESKVEWRKDNQGAWGALIEYEGAQKNAPFGLRYMLRAVVLFGNPQEIAFLRQVKRQAGHQPYAGLPDSLVEKTSPWASRVHTVKGTGLVVVTDLECFPEPNVKYPLEKDTSGMSFAEKHKESYRVYFESLQAEKDQMRLEAWLAKEAPDKYPFVYAEAGRLATLIWSRLPEVGVGLGLPGAADTAPAVSVVSPASAEVQAAGVSFLFSSRLCRQTTQGCIPAANVPVTATLEGFMTEAGDAVVTIDTAQSLDTGGGPVVSGAATGKTDGDGRLSLTYVSPVISNPGFLRGRVTLRIAAPGGVEARASITLQPPGIRGRVVSWEPFAKKDVGAANIPLLVTGGGTNQRIASNAQGHFAVAASPGRTYEIVVGVGSSAANWTWRAPIPFVEKGVVAPATLTLVYDSLGMHYSRAGSAEKRLLEWFTTMSVDRGLRGFNDAVPDEHRYRQEVGLGTHPLVKALALSRQGAGAERETNNDARVVDWFAARTLGYIGRCGDVSLYIIREFRSRFANDPDMRALTLAEIEIDDTEHLSTYVGENHVAPVIVPSIVFKATPGVAILFNGTSGEISPEVKTFGTILDAYDQDRAHVVKSYPMFRAKYETLRGMVSRWKIDLGAEWSVIRQP